MSLVNIVRDGRVAELILNRPEKLNAFNDELFKSYEDGLRLLDQDSSVSVIIVRGEGRAFSVGWDVGTPPETGTDKGAEGSRTAHADWLRLRRDVGAFTAAFEVSKPVIASIHGHCMGGATMIGVCADLAVVGTQTVIGWPVLPIGGGMLGPMSMYALGAKKAKELSYIAGSSMSGPEAAARGWANYCVDEDAVLAKARELAVEVAKTPLDMLEIKKRAANEVLIRQGFRETLENCAGWDALIHSSAGNIRMVETLNAKGLAKARDWYVGGGSLAKEESAG
jgi:enoyl-CoA hydratase